MWTYNFNPRQTNYCSFDGYETSLIVYQTSSKSMKIFGDEFVII